MIWPGDLEFANPAALAALLALPAIWWLLRASPPAPKVVRFAPFRILAGLKGRKEEAARTPWWLVLLRLALAAALIFAVAGPRLSPAPSGGPAAKAGAGPLLVVLDDGWASAPLWGRMRATLERLLDEAA